MDDNATYNPMIRCTSCEGTGRYLIGATQYTCSVCEGYGRAPGCYTCQHISIRNLPTDTVHTCGCGAMWGLDSRGRRYWVATMSTPANS